MRWILLLLALIFGWLRPIVAAFLPLANIVAGTILSSAVRHSGIRELFENWPSDLQDLRELAAKKLQAADGWDLVHGLLLGWMSCLTLTWMGWTPAWLASIIWLAALPLAGAVAYLGLAAEQYVQQPATSQIHLRGLAAFCLVLTAGSWMAAKPYPAKQHSGGLTKSDLVKTTATVVMGGRYESFFQSPQFAAQGSGGVLRADRKVVWIITNRHCLSLDDISNRVTEYGGFVRFHNGKQAPVRRFAISNPNLDLAILEIDAAGIRQGEDFTLLPQRDLVAANVGDHVMAVGSPQGLEGTHTSGSISAIRQFPIGNISVRLIQTDTAINHGNSGGPLFWEDHGMYWWIGVNTMGFEPTVAVGLNFAIHFSEALNAKWNWHRCDSIGANAAIKEIRAQ